MFTLSVRCTLSLAVLMVCLLQPTLSGQEQVISENQIRSRSINAFQDEKYGEALEGLRTLMEKYPAEALYRYYAGVCMVKLNREPDDAIELLYYASSRGVPANVYYYLGTAYHRDYNFTEAQKYYARFEQVATRHELKDYNMKHLINTCRSARELTATYNPCEVVHVTFIDLYDSLQFSQVKMKGGNLQRKSDIYFQPGEDRHALSSLMFMPAHLVRGDYVYYAGYDRRGRGGLQLFRVRRGSGGTWGEPEEIGALNSDMDELLPYFDPIEDDLYFASNGRGGIGGYDLYRSHYDAERDEWSEPINLGFPINSAMDDYLLLPGSDLGMMMFFSSRQGTDSTVTVYRVHVSEPRKKAPQDQPGALRQIASFGDVAAEALAEIESVSGGTAIGGYTGRVHGTTSERAGTGTGRKTATGSGTGTGGGTGTPTGTGTESVAARAYRAVLAEALKHQAASDSLKDLVSATRVKIRQSDDPNDRWVWQKQIMVWDKKARDSQEAADVLYARMEEMGDMPSSPVPRTIEVDTVIRDITVYRYTEENRDIRDEPLRVEGEPGGDVKHDDLVPGNNPAEDVNRFDILQHSPYDAIHTIPLDVAMPAGVFYRIQLGAFSGAVDPDAFRGLSPITGETIPEKGLIKYYAGKFSRYEDASAALSRIRSAGYEDSFIVAWYNGTQVSTQKAKQLE
jgi:hypothetical protein